MNFICSYFINNYMNKCKYCKKENKRGHAGKCAKKQKFLNDNLTKEFLLKEYVDNEKSSNEIAKSLDTTAQCVIKRLNKFGIPKRTIKQSTNTKRRNELRKNTNKKRYGYEHNFCKSHPSRVKWEKELSQSGYDNVFQRPDVKKKILETNLRKYGVKTCMELDWVKDKLRDTMLEKYGVDSPLKLLKKHRITKPHKKIIDYFKSINQDIKIEHTIQDKNFRCHADILVDTDLIIEIYGIFWHASPKKYKKNDLLNFPSKKIYAHEIWDRDKRREDKLEKLGYKMLILWEDEINENMKIVEDKICKFLKLNK